MRPLAAPTFSMAKLNIGRYISCIFLWLFAWGLSAAHSAPGTTNTVVTTDQIQAELIAYAPQGVAIGQDVWLGLLLRHKPEWHTYWKNPGDSGLPTAFEWVLPPGVVATEIAWPAPKKLPIGSLMNYGYDNTVLLPVRLQIDRNFKSGLLARDIDIKLKAFWLVCKKECIPQEGEFEVKIPLQSSSALHASLFEEAFTTQPKEVTAPAKLEIKGQTLHLSVYDMPSPLIGKKFELFPEVPEIIAPAAAWTQAWSGNNWTATIPLSPQRTDTPSLITWVLVNDSGSLRIPSNLNGVWPSPLNNKEQAALTTNKGSQQTPANDISLIAALTGALLGGLILNLMPCVFPILAIKIMGFTRHAEDRRAHRLSGIAYTAGVALSFLALGALMLGLRAAGEEIGWGFQLQSPTFVAGLAVLFTVIGLNLAGLFEFTRLFPSKLASIQSRNPVIDAFLSGMLAVGIASPCTAPFMGASLGFAIAMPTLDALLVFTALGLGMASPYLMASLIPAVAYWLPRPGVWMDFFRKFMAFPMFATVIWLLWVLGQQTGIDGAFALLAILLACSTALWAVNLPGRAATLYGGSALFLLAATLWIMSPHVLSTSQEPQGSLSEKDWQIWEPGKVEQILAKGEPVFVDFTAAWCVTCQYNKKTTLSNPDLLLDLKSKKVHLLRADWTKRDPSISAALQGLGRSGVPVYVFYQQGKQPIILSEVLSIDDVRTTLEKL